MKSIISTAICASAIGLFSFPSFATDEQKNILMVLSSYGEKNNEGELVKPGYEFDEMSKSYLVFKSAGADVTFASPKGGELLADKFNETKAYNAQFLADKEATTKLANTHKLSELDSQDFDAIYIVGGKGPMFDLVNDKTLKEHIKSIYLDDGVVGAVCHGPAALLDIKLNDGRYLVDGKRISAFTNLEEHAFTKKWSLPFSLADKLTEQGALYQQDGLMLNQVSFDGNLLTGQNPFSTTDTAIAVIEKLGLSLNQDVDFKDDRTIKLAEMFFTDSDKAKQRYLANATDYDTMLLGMLGVYTAKHATRQIERDVALALMEVTQNTINHPAIDLAMAKTYVAKNQIDKALVLLTTAKSKFENNEQIVAYLAELDV